MNIGEAAQASGLPARTLRYYETEQLLVPGRGNNGYRHYSADDVQRLQFLKRARRFGFSISDCRSLVALYQNDHRTSGEVKALAKARLEELDEAVKELANLRDTLSHLVAECRGDDAPDCPIIQGLAQAD